MYKTAAGGCLGSRKEMLILGCRGRAEREETAIAELAADAGSWAGETVVDLTGLWG